MALNFLNFSELISRLQDLIPSPNLGMEKKSFGLLVAMLLFLVSLLVNLLQRRYSKLRFNRMLAKEEAVANFLGQTHKDLGNLEWNCTIEIDGGTSPQEMGKAIHGARNKIEANIADMKKHLRSFRQYRKKEKAQEKQKKAVESPSKTSRPRSNLA